MRHAAWMVCIGLIFAAAPCFAADGNQLFSVGAIQHGLGGSGAASARDASWLLVNPAALIDLRRRIDVSVETMHLRLMSEPRGVPLAANPFAGEQHFNAWIPIPSAGVVWPLDEDNVVALGAYGVAGDRTDFDHPRTTLGLIFDNNDRRARYDVVKIPLAYAHRFENKWTLAGAVVPAVTRFRSDSLTLRLRPTWGDNEYSWGCGAGLIVGVHRAWDKFSVGAGYISETWMQEYDRYRRDLTPDRVNLQQQAQAGVAYRPVAPVELTLDYKWIDWSAIPLFGNTTWGSGLHMKDQHAVKSGVNWDINEQWAVRAGFSWATGAVRDDAVFIGALTPALARIHVGGGFTYRFDRHSSVHAAYSQSIPEVKTESGSGDVFSLLGKGTKAGYQEYSLTLGYTYEF